MNGSQDPRQKVTPDAFSVADELLGTPLAAPWRRAVAMAVDLFFIAILARAGFFFLSLAATLLFLRAAWRAGGGRFGRFSRRFVWGTLAALSLLATLAIGWSAVTDFSGFDPAAMLDGEEEVNGDGEGSLSDLGATLGEVITLRTGDQRPEVQRAADSFARRLARERATEAEIREALVGLMDTSEESWSSAVIDSALRVTDLPEAPERPSPDSLVLSLAEAIAAGDTAGIEERRRRTGRALAAGEIERLQSQIERLRERNREMLETLDESEDEGLIQWILTVADEIGIGLGWSGLYFTVFLTVFSGRTPGKWAVGIRVVRLDGKPIGWWASFNRFGGYAASIFTGLLGFFEMFWDPNRQALHDRIAATVVIRQPRGGGDVLAS